MSYSGSFRFQRYDVNTTIKNIRFFGFQGGMVTQAHPEKLGDGQSVLIENADVISGNTLVNRGAYAQTNRCDIIHFNTMDEIKNENITFDQLKTMTFNDLQFTGLTTTNNSTSDYYQTMDQLKDESITFTTLDTISFDNLKNTGILGKEIGNTQGFFRYNYVGGYTDIVAIKGKLYTVVNENTYKKLIIQGMYGFQTTRPIEAVQYGSKLYIASGSGILIYDGTTVTPMTAYTPNGLEALYIGTNGYATDPTSFLANTTGVSDTILGVTASSRYGLMNQSVVFTAYVEQIAGDILEYLFETVSSTATVYSTVRDWSTSSSAGVLFSSADDYSIRVSLRVQGTTNILSQYVLPKYTVKTTLDKVDPTGISYANLSTCNRIFVHYDRLCIYGDTTNPENLYLSHLQTFNFFPIPNTLPVMDPLRGSLQAVTRFRNFLVLFTDGSIQQLTGTDPTTFTLNPIHPTLGTVQPYSIQVMQNYLAFVGNDNGVYILKTFNYAASNDKMNVQRIDNDVKDAIVSTIANSQRILSCVYNNQYYLYVQTDTDNLLWRFYYDLGIWVRDRIDFQLKIMNTINNVITGLSVYNGVIYKLQRGIYADADGLPYEVHILSKDYDMNMPHHRKKMKQFQLLAELTSATALTVTVYGDNIPLVTQPLSHDPNEMSDADKLKITTSGPFRYTKVDITIPVTEDIQLLGYAFIFKLNTPK